MARFGRAKFLTCFYCGKRPGIKFDGTSRDFLCLHCDATNYLDEVCAVPNDGTGELAKPGPPFVSYMLLTLIEWRNHRPPCRNRA